MAAKTARTRSLETGNQLLENRRKTRKPVPRLPVIECSSQLFGRNPKIFNMCDFALLTIYIKSSRQTQCYQYLIYYSEQRRICEVLGICICVDDTSVILGVWFPTFETTLWSHFQMPIWTFRFLKMRPLACLETSKTKYSVKQPYVTEERIAHFLLWCPILLPLSWQPEHWNGLYVVQSRNPLLTISCPKWEILLTRDFKWSFQLIIIANWMTIFFEIRLFCFKGSHPSITHEVLCACHR
jgi:hypothetical protein